MNRYGDAVEAYTYTPFGETTIYSISGGVFTQQTTSPLGNVFQFTSQFHDVESNLYHFRARAYAVSLGRFLQRDPAGYVDGPNLYSYVRNNPLRFIDPSGLRSEPTSLSLNIGTSGFGSAVNASAQTRFEFNRSIQQGSTPAPQQLDFTPQATGIPVYNPGGYVTVEDATYAVVATERRLQLLMYNIATLGKWEEQGRGDEELAQQVRVVKGQYQEYQLQLSASMQAVSRAQANQGLAFFGGNEATLNDLSARTLALPTYIAGLGTNPEQSRNQVAALQAAGQNYAEFGERANRAYNTVQFVDRAGTVVGAATGVGGVVNTLAKEGLKQGGRRVAIGVVSGVAADIVFNEVTVPLAEQFGVSEKYLNVGLAVFNIIQVSQGGFRKGTPKRIPDPDGGFTADLSKSNAKSRSGHRNAGNKQLNEAMENDPALRARMEQQHGSDVFDRTSTSGSGRRNPANTEWDHNTNNPNALDLRTKPNHRQKSSSEGQAGGGWKRFHKE